MSHAKIASLLQSSLGLTHAPVALKPARSAPAGVADFTGSVPSACSFWRLAEKAPFFAPAAAHKNCPVGNYTMGLPMTDDVSAGLQQFVGYMCETAYIAKEEVAGIPRYTGAPEGFVYGPLATFEGEPLLALVWVEARQAMLLEEALGDVAWSGPKSQAFGRPACAALAAAANENKAAVSFGCSGMRTFTDVADSLHLIAIPGAILPLLVEKLEKTQKSNEAMLAFYRQHKASFPSLDAQPVARA